jgi:AcrR family transcriptional regulator
MSDQATTGGRRERTRAALLQAGRELITAKGVAGLRITEITEGAGVALGSFYNHFPSKEDLVDTVVADSLGSLAEALATPAADQDPAELVGFAIRRFVGFAGDDPDYARLVVHLDHADALFMRAVYPAARRALELGVESGRLSVPDIEVAVVTILGGSLALMRAIVDGRVGPGAESAYAETCLRSLGISSRQAAAIARRPMPAIAELASTG